MCTTIEPFGLWLAAFQTHFQIPPDKRPGPAAGIDATTPQRPKRLPALAGQSDARSSCRAWAGPFSDCGVVRKARLPPEK